MRRACVLPLPFLIAVIANGACQAESSPPWLASHTPQRSVRGQSASLRQEDSNACRCIRKWGRMAARIADEACRLTGSGRPRAVIILAQDPAAGRHNTPSLASGAHVK